MMILRLLPWRSNMDTCYLCRSPLRMITGFRVTSPCAPVETIWVMYLSEVLYCQGHDGWLVPLEPMCLAIPPPWHFFVFSTSWHTWKMTAFLSSIWGSGWNCSRLKRWCLGASFLGNTCSGYIRTENRTCLNRPVAAIKSPWRRWWLEHTLKN